MVKQQMAGSKTMNVLLWAAQVTTAVFLAMGAAMKFMPVAVMAPQMPWMGELPVAAVRFLGGIDLLGAIGLVLPALLRIRPHLTPVAASMVVLLMACASVFHIMRGEARLIGFNIFVGIIAAFIAWGRFKKALILPNRS